MEGAFEEIKRNSYNSLQSLLEIRFVKYRVHMHDMPEFFADFGARIRVEKRRRIFIH